MYIHFAITAGLPDFSWYNIPKQEKIPNDRKNGHKIYLIAMKIPKGHDISRNFPFQGLKSIPKLGFW
jgi:hypothetical protein